VPKQHPAVAFLASVSAQQRVTRYYPNQARPCAPFRAEARCEPVTTAVECMHMLTVCTEYSRANTAFLFSSHSFVADTAAAWLPGSRARDMRHVLVGGRSMWHLGRFGEGLFLFWEEWLSLQKVLCFCWPLEEALCGSSFVECPDIPNSISRSSRQGSLSLFTSLMPDAGSRAE
jgi:hypothetical protein